MKFERLGALWLGCLLLVGSVLLLALSSLVLPAPAEGGEAKRLAVLELSGDFPVQELNILSDQLRQGALGALKGSPYEVMTRENMEMLARDMGIDLAACQEGAVCEVDYGRSIGADLVLSGGLARYGSKLTATIKLHDTDKGSLLSSRGVRAANEDELYDQLPAAAAALVRDGLDLGRGARGRTSAPVTAQEGTIGEQSSSLSLDNAAQEAIVSFESTPPGAVVLLDGDLLCSSTPCRKRIEVGSYRVVMQAERYHPVTEDVVVKSGRSAVTLALKPRFARLTVTTKPPGLGVLLSGNKVGEAGLRGEKLDPGAYEVLIDDRCYLRGGERVVLDEGQERTVELVAQERKAGLRVDVEDSAGNVLDGEVWVDGKKLGDALGSFELPYCSQKVEVSTSGHGKWSKELSLVENEVTTLRAVLAGAPDGARDAAASPPPGDVPVLRGHTDEYMEDESWQFVMGLSNLRASSTLASQSTNDYGAGMMSDGYQDTAWVEGEADYGVGESITFTWVATGEDDHSCDGLLLMNGYQKSRAHMEQNSRVKTLDMYVDGTLYRRLEVQDRLGYQWFDTGDLQQGQSIKLVITAVYEGTRWKDTSISELMTDCAPRLP